jgi:hypothetical protein
MVALKAEYGVGSAVRWHVVPDLDGSALCHRLLSPIAEMRPITDMTHDVIDPENLCQLCLTAFKCGAETVDDRDDTDADYRTPARRRQVVGPGHVREDQDAGNRDATACKP